MGLTRAQKLRDSVNLDDIAYKIAMEADLSKEIEKAKVEQKLLRDEITARIQGAGATYGTVFGRPVVRFQAIDRVAVKSLIEDYEELVQPYMREVTVEELDMTAFTRDHADIVDKYRVRQWGREK